MSVGGKTVGKNVAQAVMPLSDGSGICFTVREFFTPMGYYMGSGHCPTLNKQAINTMPINTMHNMHSTNKMNKSTTTPTPTTSTPTPTIKTTSMRKQQSVVSFAKALFQSNHERLLSGLKFIEEDSSWEVRGWSEYDDRGYVMQ